MAKDENAGVALTALEKSALTRAARRNRRSVSAEIRARIFRSGVLQQGEDFRELMQEAADDAREEDPELAGLLDAVVEHLQARENEAKGATYAQRNPKTPRVSERLQEG